jgi:uncharacterized NAD(P)/FAD-binding protein YdhS
MAARRIPYNAAMADIPNDGVFDIAIIGGGAGGVLAAIHALRLAASPGRIALVEPAETLGEGAAYATRHPEHLLNVPARGMSAFAGNPGDFLDYVAATDATGAGREELSARFVERHRYGEYLRARLGEARGNSPATLGTVRDRVVALDFEGESARLTLAGGMTLHAHGVILAIGNTPRPLPAQGAEALAPAQALPAWDFDAIKRIDRGADVCIVGSGLSMADALLSLDDNGHRGVLHVLSRHALLPLPHAADPAVADFDVPALLALPLRPRLRAVRERVREAVAAGLPWQSVFERLRPHGQALWQSLSAQDERRFLRHVVRYWDIHRHRIAPQVHGMVMAAYADGRLRLHRGRLLHARPQAGRVRLGYRQRDGRVRELDVDVVVNATGVELRARAMRNPLLDALLARGLARHGPHGIGIDTAADGRVLDAHGGAHPRLFALGSLRIGTLWESLAVPELRAQAESAARALLAPPAR